MEGIRSALRSDPEFEEEFDITNPDDVGGRMGAGLSRALAPRSTGGAALNTGVIAATITIDPAFTPVA